MGWGSAASMFMKPPQALQPAPAPGAKPLGGLIGQAAPLPAAQAPQFTNGMGTQLNPSMGITPQGPGLVAPPPQAGFRRFGRR